MIHPRPLLGEPARDGRPYLALNMVATADGRAAVNGSAVGIGSPADKHLMRELRAEADVVLHDGVPRVYRSLPFADQVVQSSHVIGPYDSAIILECDSIHRTRLEGLENRFLISIDHGKVRFSRYTDVAAPRTTRRPAPPPPRARRA